MISIPINGGITEGGAIIIVIASTILAFVILAILILLKYGSDIRKVAIAARDNAAVTKEHTANHHNKNLREDLDQKDEAQNEKLDKVLAAVESNNRRFDRVNDRITGLDRRMTGIDARLNKMGNN